MLWNVTKYVRASGHLHRLVSLAGGTIDVVTINSWAINIDI